MAWSAPTEWERWDPEQLLVCPYDEVHKVAAKRFQYHLLKCRKNHPEKDFVPCPFNAKHVMLRPALRHHVATCPDRSVIEQYSFKGSTKDSDGFYFKGDTSLPGYSHRDWELQPSESWDDDDETQIPVGQFQPHRQSQQLPSAEQIPQRGTLGINSKERRDLKEQLRRQAVQAAQGTGMQNDQRDITVRTTTQSLPMRPSNNSIYMYGLQKTNQAQQNATVNTPGISQTNRIPSAQAPRPTSAGRGIGLLAAMSPRSTLGSQPTVQGYAVRPLKSSSNDAEVYASLPSQRLLEEVRKSPEDYSSRVPTTVQSCAVRLPESSSNTAEVYASLPSQRLFEEVRKSPEDYSSRIRTTVPQSCAVRPSESSPNTSEVHDPLPSQRSPEEVRKSPEHASSRVSAQLMGSASSCNQQSVSQQNFQSNRSVNKTGLDIPVRLSYPSGQGVGRARLMAEARKNNFGGICSAYKTTDLSASFGRGRGVFN